MGGNKKIKIHFVIAHVLEAKPFIDFYGLSKNHSHYAFDLFENDEIRLIISGEGKVNSTAATGYCAGLSKRSEQLCLWINIGIAGHKTYPIGGLLRVNKVLDWSNNRSLYPSTILRSSNIKGCCLITVDKPEIQYEQDCLYDMEASGFFQTACRFVSLEYINSFKIVSDNRANSVNSFSRDDVISMIEPHIESIDSYLSDLKNELFTDINNGIQSIEIKEEIMNSYYLTYCQQKIVYELLDSLMVHGSAIKIQLPDSNQPNELIKNLRNQLSKIELSV